ncbi:hypothetical protein ACN2CC_07365 [Mesorhizobium muleiense]|uniref:hypothetical protein n=1 Tax=Mesorhizobium muleiense TaxID=1004279 RepID=UPI003AFB6D9C
MDDGKARLCCCEMILAPRSFRSTTIVLLSKVLSAINPPRDAARIEMVAWQENEAHEVP